MQVKEIMTQNPQCASPDTSLQQIAQFMVDKDCGGIPVCDPQSSKLIGFVTDRDIVCRVVSKGLDTSKQSASSAMSTELHTITPDASVDDCVKLMNQFKVKRVPVVDSQGKIVGIVAEADLIQKVVAEHPEMVEEFEETLEEIYQPKASV